MTAHATVGPRITGLHRSRWLLALEGLGRLLRHGARGSTPLIILVVLYCALYSGLLMSSGFLPYVFDNNESFSNLNHARNLIGFGVADSAGLADEAVSPKAEAHPVVHTHQGNMPRLYAAILHLIGLQSVESQIVATTFTVGLAAVVMAFLFFRFCAGPGFAFLACLVLISDYIFFAQWQVNTYRVWIPFLTFASLLTAECYAQSRRPLWLAAIAATGLLLFYFELSFAFFITVMTALYMAWRLRDSWRHLLLGWFAFGLGGATSLVILLLQLVSHLGWQDLVRDLELTFMARNFGENSEAYIDALRSFYGSRNIAFFYNVGSSELTNWWSGLWAVLLAYHARITTPLVTIFVVIVGSGFALRGLADRLRGHGRAKAESDQSLYLARVIFIALLAAFFFQLLWLSNQWSVRGIAGFASSGLGGALLTAAIVGLVVALSLRQLNSLAQARDSGIAIRLACACVLLLVVSGWTMAEHSLYDGSSQILWSHVLAFPSARVWHVAGIASLVLAWIAAILLPRSRATYGPDFSWYYLFMTCGVIAAMATYAVFPGYVRSGYLVRGETFLVGHLAAAIAFALFVTVQLAREFHARASLLLSVEYRSGFARRSGLLLGAGSGVAALAAAIVVGQWVYSQSAYARLFPPDQFSWLKLLESEQLRGRSLVSNNYAVPFALATGGWGYIDTRFASGGFERTSDGFAPVHSYDYLWLADANTNPDYKKPELFVCFIGLSLQRAARLAEGREINGCSDLGLVSETLGQGWRPFSHRLYAIDSSPWNSWAIVQLDWTASPFLRRLEQDENGTYVTVGLNRDPRGRHQLDVRYQYQQQDGHDEAGTVVRVYRADRRGDGCPLPVEKVGGAPPNEMVIERKDANAVKLPEMVRGPVVVSVRPASAQRAGQEYFSDIIWVGESDGGC